MNACGWTHPVRRPVGIRESMVAAGCKPTALECCSRSTPASTTRRCFTPPWRPGQYSSSAESSRASARSSGPLLRSLPREQESPQPAGLLGTLPRCRRGGKGMSPSLPAGGASPWRRNVFLVARREILIRLRSRVFAGSTVVMVVLVAGGILAASYFQVGTPSQPAAVRVGFSGGAQTLEQSFRSTAAALGETVTVTDVADPGTGRSQVEAGTVSYTHLT